MPIGTPVNRQWVVVLRDGRVAIEWGEGVFQDALDGEFIQYNSAFVSHHAKAEDLERLRHAARVVDFNDRIVYFQGLPELPRKTIE